MLRDLSKALAGGAVLAAVDSTGRVVPLGSEALGPARAPRQGLAYAISVGALSEADDPLDLLVALRNALSRDGVLVVAEALTSRTGLDVVELAGRAGFTRVRRARDGDPPVFELRR